MPQRLAQIQLAVIVLNLDCGVVHQDPDRQRQPAEGHNVETLIQHVEHGDRGED